METKRRIIFVHIPKTAGSSFLGILQSQFSPERVFNINAGSIHTAKRYYELTNEILHGLDSRIISNSALIYGHMPFVLNDKYESFDSITFLRDPIKRVVSDYRYTRATPKNPLHYILQNMSLKEYVSQYKDLHLDNLQTRLISGKISGELRSEDLDLAEYNLNSRFKFYGITEYFDYSLVLLNQSFGWQVSSYSLKNVTKPGSSNVVESDLAAVRNHNSFDVLLYQRSTKKFLKQIESQKSFYEEEVKKINRINTTFGLKAVKTLLSKFKRLIG